MRSSRRFVAVRTLVVLAITFGVPREAIITESQEPTTRNEAHRMNAVLRERLGVREIDRIVVALRHLPSVGARDAGRRRQLDLGLREDRAVEVVEAAHDLARLAAYIIREFPEYYRLFGEREFTWNGIKQANRNLLLGTYAGADGLKTGHTAASGYGMVASAQQDGRRLILVVNGLKSEAERAAETKRLFDLGFREFRAYTLLKAGDVVGQAEVWAGEMRDVPLAIRQPVKVLMRRASREGLKVQLSYLEPVIPPVARGQELGKLTITAPGVPETVVPVFAGADVEAGGWFTQIKVGIKELLSSAPEPAPISQDVTPTADAPTQ